MNNNLSCLFHFELLLSSTDSCEHNTFKVAKHLCLAYHWKSSISLLWFFISFCFEKRFYCITQTQGSPAPASWVLGSQKDTILSDPSRLLHGIFCPTPGHEQTSALTHHLGSLHINCLLCWQMRKEVSYLRKEQVGWDGAGLRRALLFFHDV